ncbi:MAG: carbohydrate-binding protein [Verrucomicrobia bacterium]|nr:carbohydrate-binding protein [Verrucomicrobiota bacterium]
MRKQIIKAPNLTGTSEEWLNLEEIAQVEVSSEDPKHPIESAFKHGENLGWRASQPGEQTIRLLFDEPKDLRRIRVRFSEPQVERTQQFTLRWADSQTGSFREIVRQQWNFNPRSSTIELEDYKVDLHHVLALELIIDPDLGRNQAFAALAEWRIA